MEKKISRYSFHPISVKVTHIVAARSKHNHFSTVIFGFIDQKLKKLKNLVLTIKKKKSRNSICYAHLGCPHKHWAKKKTTKFMHYRLKKEQTKYWNKKSHILIHHIFIESHFCSEIASNSTEKRVYGPLDPIIWRSLTFWVKLVILKPVVLILFEALLFD